MQNHFMVKYVNDKKNNMLFLDDRFKPTIKHFKIIVFLLDFLHSAKLCY